MIFRIDATVPANTTYDEPVIVAGQMLPGTIVGVRIEFPPGCAGLARCLIREKSTQLWPSLEATYFSGDTYPIEFKEDYVLRDEPFTFDLVAWNIDNLYPHTVTAYINLLTGVEGWKQLFRQMIGG